MDGSDLYRLQLWYSTEFEKGSRVKASKIFNLFEKYFEKSTEEQKNTYQKIKARLYPFIY